MYVSVRLWLVSHLVTQAVRHTYIHEYIEHTYINIPADREPTSLVRQLTRSVKLQLWRGVSVCS